MADEMRRSGGSKAMTWVGWVVSALPVLALAASAVMKLTRSPQATEGLTKGGYSDGVIVPLGIVELSCAILYAIPRTSVLGAILVTGYLGGATDVHVRGGQSVLIPVALGVLAWVGLFLRDARVRALIPLRS